MRNGIPASDPQVQGCDAMPPTLPYIFPSASSVTNPRTESFSSYVQRSCRDLDPMGIIRSLLRRSRRAKSKAPSPSSPSSPSASRPASDLELVFKKFDSNGDGRISTPELANILESLGQTASDEELARMMAVADADGDGFISLTEFLDLMSADDASALEDLRHAFAVFDTDRSGSISAEELATVLRSLGEGASVAQCRRMIDCVDRDGDGMVNFEEFKIMMTSRSSSLTTTHKI